MKLRLLSIAMALTAIFGAQEAVAKNATTNKHHHQKKHKTHAQNTTIPGPMRASQLS